MSDIIPNIFIVGKTKTGKSTFAKLFCEKILLCSSGEVHVEASVWVRAGCGSDEQDPAFREKATRYAAETLAKDALFSANNIKERIEKVRANNATMPCAISGIRNPVDFLRLYNPTHDYVIFLGQGLPSMNTFDDGVDRIFDTMVWLLDIGIIDTTRFNIEDVDIGNNTYANVENYMFANNKLHRKFS